MTDDQIESKRLIKAAAARVAGDPFRHSPEARRIAAEWLRLVELDETWR